MIFGKGEKKDFRNKGSKRVNGRVENHFGECERGALTIRTPGFK